MLVLARKPSESIKIGDSIIVKVIAIRGGQVKLGIEAPPGIRVIRTDSHFPNGTPSNHINGSPNGSCTEAASNGKETPCSPRPPAAPDTPSTAAAPGTPHRPVDPGAPSPDKLPGQ